MTAKRGGNYGRSPGGGLRAIEDAFLQRQTQAQALRQRIAQAATSTVNATQSSLVRRSIASPLSISFAERRDAEKWLQADAGAPFIRAILDAVADGTDRALLAWPAQPGSGFVAAAIALRQAKSSGELAHASFGYWPWRPGATAAAKQVLVEPTNIGRVARALATDIKVNKAPWALESLAHESLCILEMSVSDLGKADSLRSQDIVVRRPTLLETTAVFPPDLDRADVYSATAVHLLYRIQKYTWLRKALKNADSLLREIEDPLKCPFAIFGLPSAVRTESIERCLRHTRIRQQGLDVVIADLTRTSRANLADNWEKALEALLKGLGTVKGRRPAVAVLCDDAFALRRAARLIRIHNAAQKPFRPSPKQIGAYLAVPGLLGPLVPLPVSLPDVDFRVDIKDAELAPLRSELVALGRALRESGSSKAASGASQALTFLRRVASLPVGLNEAFAVARQIYDSDDDSDARLRALFMPKMELKALADVERDAPSFSKEAERLCRKIEDKIDTWKEETPVSIKLSSLLDGFPNNAEGVIVVIPDRRVAEVFLSAERSLRWQCIVRDRNGLEDALAQGVPKELVVVGPTPEVIRSILVSPYLPNRVHILGDVAGIGLIVAELGPAENLDAFAALKPRAVALKKQILRHGGDETLDLSETEFSVAATVREGIVDLTRSGGVYSGDIIRIETASGGIYLYRPTSDVLVHSPSEARAFEKLDAGHITKGMDILALSRDVREIIRQALAGSRKVLDQIKVYHDAIRMVRERTPGNSNGDKAAQILFRMIEIDPNTPREEVHNIRRWIVADIAPEAPNGGRQPGAARDFSRFQPFCRAVGIPEAMIEPYWRVAILPTRSFRVQEAHDFNKRIVQFVLDPESTALTAGAISALPELWKHVEDAIDEVINVTIEKSGVRQHG